jgi:hypothetical protein
MEVSDQLYAPTALPPGKETPLHIGQEAGSAPEQVWTRWRREKRSTLTGTRTPVVNNNNNNNNNNNSGKSHI